METGNIKKMNNLKDIVEEIEEFGRLYRNSKDKDARREYNQYIELIITDANKSEQYNLCDYWERLIR